MEIGAWKATVHGVAESQRGLSDRDTHMHSQGARNTASFFQYQLKSHVSPSFAEAGQKAICSHFLWSLPLPWVVPEPGKESQAVGLVQVAHQGCCSMTLLGL